MVGKSLVGGREHGSFVLQELPFNPVLVALLLPPGGVTAPRLPFHPPQNSCTAMYGTQSSNALRTHGSLNSPLPLLLRLLLALFLAVGDFSLFVVFSLFRLYVLKTKTQEGVSLRSTRAGVVCSINSRASCGTSRS